MLSCEGVSSISSAFPSAIPSRLRLALASDASYARIIRAYIPGSTHLGRMWSGDRRSQTTRSITREGPDRHDRSRRGPNRRGPGQEEGQKKLVGTATVGTTKTATTLIATTLIATTKANATRTATTQTGGEATGKLVRTPTALAENAETQTSGRAERRPLTMITETRLAVILTLFEDFLLQRKVLTGLV